MQPIRTAAAFAFLFLSLAQVALAQGYPSKPIHIVVPYPAGGGIDLIARAVGSQLTQRWGQSVVVENKPGSGTIVARRERGQVRARRPHAAAHHRFHHHHQSAPVREAPYDPVRDFAPVTQLVFLNQLLLANPAVPANNLKELIAYAKANPDKLNYASYGSGSQPNLAMEMLKSQAGIQVVHVPYKGIPQAVPAVIAGEVQLTFSGCGLEHRAHQGRPPEAARHRRQGPPRPAARGAHVRRAGFPRHPVQRVVRPVRAGGHAARGDRSCTARSPAC